MKALRLVLLASFLMAGMSATANTNTDDCSQVASGKEITRDDKYANPQKTAQIVNAAILSPTPAKRPALGQDSAVTHY